LTCEEVAGDDDIGKVHTVADQEGLVEEVVVQDLDSHLDDLINPLEQGFPTFFQLRTTK
jgi:hypothetical protein